jgi:hypothetical protein
MFHTDSSGLLISESELHVHFARNHRKSEASQRTTATALASVRSDVTHLMSPSILHDLRACRYSRSEPRGKEHSPLALRAGMGHNAHSRPAEYSSAHPSLTVGALFKTGALIKPVGALFETVRGSSLGARYMDA